MAVDGIMALAMGGRLRGGTRGSRSVVTMPNMLGRGRGRALVLACSLVVLLLALPLPSLASPEDDPWELARHLGSKTPYLPHQEYSTYTPPPSGCRAIHLNLLARHGSRFPNSGDIKSFAHLEGIIAKHGDHIPYPWMRNWLNPFEVEDAGFLTAKGMEEHYALAKRMRAYYKDLLSPSYDPSRFKISSTEVSRAGISANAYSFALFEGKGLLGPDKFDPFFVWSTNKTTDYLLRFFDTCTAYNREVFDNDSSQVESNKYADLALPPLAQKLTLKLNTPGWTLSVHDVKVLWSLCAFQLSAQNISDQFCSFFEKEDVQTLNYLDDLSTYWNKGYGYPITARAPCLLFNDFLTAIDEVIDDDEDDHTLRATLRFAHAETVMPFLSLLGLFKDTTPLFANSTKDQIMNRQWAQSYIATFAANVALVLYNCSKVADDHDYRVKLLHSEKEYVVPGCDGQMYCPYDNFKQIYKTSVDCDFFELCQITPCEQDADHWQMSTARTAIIIVCACIAAFLAGLAVMGGLWVVVHCCNKHNHNNYNQVAQDVFTL